MTRLTSASVIAAMLFVAGVSAQGTLDTGITISCSNAIKGAVEKLLPEYERASKSHVTIRYGASAILKRGIEGGEPFDLALLTPAVIADLTKSGHIAAGSGLDIAKSDLGVGIRAGSPKTGIATADALKRRLLAAKSITYSKEGGSTASFVAALTRLGIVEAMAPKTVLQTVSGRPAESVAEGENELVFAPVSEIMSVPGLEVLGLFPAEFQNPLVVTAGIGAKSARANAARAFVQFLQGPRASQVIKASGLDPFVKK